MVESTRAHERIEPTTYPGLSFELDELLPRPIEVYVPAPSDTRHPLKLLIHFHGPSFVPRHAVFHASERYVLAVVNLGSGSSVYERAFSEPVAFDRLLSALDAELDRRGLHTGFDAIVLSAFSAGYGAVRALLQQHFEAIDGVLLLDGLHADYVPPRTPLADGGRVDSTDMAPFLTLGRAAMAKQKRFLFSHSEVFPGTYASTTETADYLIRMLGLERTAVLRWGPVGMQQLSEVRQGHCTILGFAGNTAPDHIDHFHALPHFLERFSE